jgi:NADH-quinone oxidoreductase subunit G
VLRVLGNQLGLGGFDYDTPEAVRAEAVPGDIASRLSNRLDVTPTAGVVGSEVERIADVPPYFTDAIVRRAEALQQTADARMPKASANAKTLAGFGLAAGDKARVKQGDATALLECAVDDRLPDGVVRVPAGHASTSTLGAMFGAISLERP